MPGGLNLEEKVGSKRGRIVDILRVFTPLWGAETKGHRDPKRMLACQRAALGWKAVSSQEPMPSNPGVPSAPLPVVSPGEGL